MVKKSFSSQLRQILTATSVVLAAMISHAQSLSPQGLNVQGRIVRPDSSGVEGNTVQFQLQIRSPGVENCVLFEEIHTLNMADSDGVFNLKLGGGNRTGSNFKDVSTLAQVFDNSVGAINSLSCVTGTSYDPASSDPRKLRISFDEGTGIQTLAQDQMIQSVPYALYADRLQGKQASDLISTVPALEATPGTSQSRVNRLIDTDWAGLDALLLGTSTLYAKASPTAAVSNNNQRLINVADPTSAQDAATKNYTDTTIGGYTATVGVLVPADAGKAITWDGTKWVASAVSTTDATKVAKAGDTMTGTLNLPANGLVAGTNQLVLNGGNVGIGTASPVFPVHVDNSANPIIVNDYISSTAGASAFITRRARGTSAAPTNVQSGDTLGTFSARGYTSTGWSAVSSAGISMVAEEDFTGFKGTKIVFDTTALGTNSRTTKMTIQGDGSVGIGTTAPGFPLEVNGTVKANIFSTGQANGTAGAVQIGVGDFNTGFFRPTGNNLGVATAGIERMRLDGFGNVGIGTTSPASPLHVVGDIRSTTGLVVSGYGGFNYTSGKGLSMATGGATPLDFSTSGQTRMTVTTAGNVGIGTTSPDRLLHVAGPMRIAPAALPGTPAAGDLAFDSAASNALKFYDGSAWQTVGTGVGSGDFLANGTVPMTATLRGYDGNATTPGLSFAGDSDTGFYSVAGGTVGFVQNGVERIRFSSTIQSLTTNAFHLSNGVSAAFPSYAFNNDTDNGMYRVTTDSIGFSTAGTHRMSIEADGDIVVNKTSAANGKFDVAGSIVMSGGTSGHVGFQPAAAAGSTIYTLPAAPVNGNVLSTDASGVLSWIAPGSGVSIGQTAGTAMGADAVPNCTASQKLQMSLGPTFAWSCVSDANAGGDFKADGTVAMTSNIRLGGHWLSNDGGNEGVYVNTDGNVGVGTTSLGGARFAIDDNPWSQTGDYTGLNTNVVYNAGTTNTGTVTANRTYLLLGDSRTSNLAYGTYNHVLQGSTGAATEIGAAYNGVQRGNTGAVTSIYGSKNYISNEAAGTVTNAYGIFSDINSSAGTVTNAYGVYIDTMAGTNRWGIYQNGSTDSNYFAGKVGIGTSTPSVKLEVDGPIVSKPRAIASGVALDLSLSNTFTLASVGGTAGSAITIALSNPAHGGVYTFVITDTVSHVYDFSGCTAKFWKPASAATTTGTRSIFTLTTINTSGTDYDCYISWASGYQ